MLRRGTVVGQSRIDAAAVTPDICATLLFLVAEANADAAEAAKRIVADPQTSNAVERALLSAIRNLAQGRLIEIVRQETPEVAGVEAKTGEQALQALQLMLLRGVKSLALQLRRRVDVAPSSGGIETAGMIFTRVKQLSVEPIEDVLDTGDPVFSLYPGRNHREAIDRGYLAQGTSSAISFPTGGGKSTLAELKIATALLRGEKVVFLAP